MTPALAAPPRAQRRPARRRGLRPADRGVPRPAGHHLGRGPAQRRRLGVRGRARGGRRGPGRLSRLGRRAGPEGLRPERPAGRRRELRTAPLRLARLPADHHPLVPAPPGPAAARAGRLLPARAGPDGGARSARSHAFRTTRPRRCPAPGSYRTRRRCARRSGRRWPSICRPCWTASAPRMRRGPRALWGMASDEIVEGLWYIGHLLGEEPRAVTEARAAAAGGHRAVRGERRDSAS